MKQNKKTTDSKLIAAKQLYEMKYICSVWHDADGKHLPMSVLKEIVNKSGKSRRAVYAVLKYLNYTYKAKNKK